MNARTSVEERIEYLRLVLVSLEGHLARGEDLRSVVQTFRKALMAKEKEMQA